MISVLYAYSDGAYSQLRGVDLWCEQRDARNYNGPNPVVAHPPCSRVADDGGCFAHALWAVRTFGGVLEHPAKTLAWSWHGIAKPPTSGEWIPAGDGHGWTCHVYQRQYGHEAYKPTWLYYVGEKPQALIPGRGPAPTASVGPSKTLRRLRGKEASHTPDAFRDMLLSLARSAK